MNFIQHMRNARERAIVENMKVVFVESGLYEVENKDKTNTYQVQVVNKKIDSCSCPQYAKVGFCKHMVKVSMKSGFAVKIV
jgi:hypothetical protein